MIIINNQRVWQIGTGDSTRDYSRLCLDWGIAIVGPGEPGDSRKSETQKYYLETGLKDWGKCLFEIRKEEIVLLRRGQTNIIAVGIVEDEYNYSESLSDIHGWDLNHYISVRWFVKEDETNMILPSPMIGYSTMSEVRANYDYIKNLMNSSKLKQYPRKHNIKEIKIPKRITDKDIRQFLIDKGIRIADAINITETINRIITLVKWYINNDPNVLEHELRTFFVIPFLLSLGWSEQKIKIEYNKIDIALFKKSYNKNENQQPLVIIETKTFNDGLLF